MILGELGCHSIQDKTKYVSAANPDGDNKNAICIYKNEYLTCVNYTRNISDNKSPDIFNLIEHIKKVSFFDSLKYTCDILGLDYYKDWNDDIPESLKITKLINDIQDNDYNQYDEDKPVSPINECILTYYLPCVNIPFYNDGISYNTQQLFEIGYDDLTNRITIPIRDELGTFIGVKGRLLIEDNVEPKYMYIEPCNRSKILYGLYITYEFIRDSKLCYVGESEKSVMQLWSYDIYNSVGIGGKNLSNAQIEKLTRLSVPLVFLFDKDVSVKEIEDIADRFIEQVQIYAIIDKDDILSCKESPTDNKDKLLELIRNHKYKIN
jgi:DNA primase